MLTQLTPEQEARLPYYTEKWVRIGNSTVAPDFYTPSVKSQIAEAIICLYAAAGMTLTPDQIIPSPSPLLSPFIAAATELGKSGTPKRKVKCKLDYAGPIETYLNGFTNPMEIIKRSGQYLETRSWGSPDAGYWSFIDFFKTETELGQGPLKPFERVIEALTGVIIPFTYDLIVAEKFCVWSAKPTHMDLDTSGAYPVAKGGEIKWADGTTLTY